MVSDRMLADFFDLAPAALLVRSLEDERIVAVNRAFEALAGYRREDVVGKTPTELPIFDPIRDHYKNVLRVAQEGTITDVKVDILHADGRVLPIEFSASRAHVQGTLFVISVLRAAPSE